MITHSNSDTALPDRRRSKSIDQIANTDSEALRAENKELKAKLEEALRQLEELKAKESQRKERKRLKRAQRQSEGLKEPTGHP